MRRDAEDRLRVLSDVMRAFAEATANLDQLLHVIASRVSGVVADSCRVLLTSEDGKALVLGAFATVDEKLASRVGGPLGEYPLELAKFPVLAEVLASSTSVWIPRVTSPEARAKYHAKYLDAATAQGIHSLLIVPLRAHGRSLGVLILTRVLDASPPFDENDVELAQNLGDHAALAISNARVLKRAKEAAELNRVVFDASPAPMFIHDSKSLRLLAVNHAFCALYGYSQTEALALTVRELRAADDPVDDRTLRDVESAADVPLVKRHRKADGALMTIEGSSRPMMLYGRPCRLAVFNDITEKQRHQEELRQVQKMDAIGVLAGGIAHDFNNVLSVILSYADLIRSDLAEENPMRDDVEEIRIAAQSAADLARQLLMFSSKQVLAPRVLDLNDLLRGVNRMARRIAGEGVELVSLLAPDLWHVKVDQGSFERVLVNLVVNARDALRPGGKITMRTSNEERGGERFVAVSVRDDGIGMTEATRDRIFEPFFTTKERGRGTGLGLSTVFGIMHQSGGTVDVESTLGAGSTFTVRLPAVNDDELAALTPHVATTSARGTETILLVEDEDQVRAVAKSTLAAHGYLVLDARDPAEATRLCREHDEPIALLLSDVVLPQIGGPELAKRLLVERPDMKVLFMSGYTDDAGVRKNVLHGKVAFLQKPFTMQLLTFKVREVLDS